MSTATSESTAAGGLDFDEIELTLGLPGESRDRNSGTKRHFADLIDLKLCSSEDPEIDKSDGECSELDAGKPRSKERVVGWPPVRSYRKNAMKSNCKYVKVAVDGAPYLRKVDLQSYAGYQQLLCVFEEMFPCFMIPCRANSVKINITDNVLIEKKMMNAVNGSEHVPTYEDKDGDWMLFGDVPWKMFVETCKRIRLMRTQETIINQLGLAPTTLRKYSTPSR